MRQWVRAASADSHPTSSAPIDAGSRAPVPLVEGDNAYVTALTAVPEREGFAVTALAVGRRAVAATEQTVPDVIHLDVMLPGLSGVETCRERRHRGVRTAVIMVSAHSDGIEVVLALDGGADDYVTTP